MGVAHGKDQLVRGPWTTDIKEYPQSHYHFQLEGYNCTIERNPTDWTYQASITVPESHPAWGGPVRSIYCNPLSRFYVPLTERPCTTSRGTFTIECSDVSPVDETLRLKGEPVPLTTRRY